jgi:Cu(I)/Ag(I) efflux system membrane protein CusA/SilA
MTVSTVVAGLLPIMWSVRTGAEVMKPLATPVLGGMVSSLLHVLIVTPVVFYWLRARELPAGTPVERAPTRQRARAGRRVAVVAAAAVAVSLVVGAAWWRLHGTDRVGSDLTAIQTVTSGDLRVTLLNTSGTLRQGRTDFIVKFRSRKGRARGAGTVRAWPRTCHRTYRVRRDQAPDLDGRTLRRDQFGMSGRWQMTVSGTDRRATGPHLSRTCNGARRAHAVAGPVCWSSHTRRRAGQRADRP